MSAGGLRVLAPALHMTVQDFGRIGAQALGIPVSGALDRETLRLANALVGNAADEAGLEILQPAPVFEVTAPALRVALGAYGGELLIEAAGHGVVPPWHAATLPRGARVTVAAPRGTACAYLAIGGGIAVPQVAGSRATYVRGGFGGWQGRPLVSGDHLRLRRDAPPAGPDRRLAITPIADDGPFRVVLGPQDDHFTAEAIETLGTAEYLVTHEADRMGLRLDGPALAHRAGHDIVSDATAFGAIQVAGDGRPVLLLADRQTTGGYPKIAAICTADLPRAGRLRPGDRVRFAPVGVAAAQSLHRWHEAAVRTMLEAMVPVGDAAPGT